jgi:hypothetical protein
MVFRDSNRYSISKRLIENPSLKISGKGCGTMGKKKPPAFFLP